MSTENRRNRRRISRRAVLGATGAGAAALALERNAGSAPAPTPRHQAEASPTAGLADLVVDGLSLSPARPFAGDTVRFQATVRNRGTAPTPDGVVIGGIFRVDGATVVYTDDYATSLGPGETVVLTSNGGGASGDGTWRPLPGTHALGFLVDDVNRIEESDEDNNEFVLDQPLSVATRPGPDLVVQEITWSPLAVRAGTAVTFAALVMNRGTEPTPADTPVVVEFRVDGRLVATNDSRTEPIPAGQAVALTGSGGPAGSGAWRATAGRHAVQAVIDPSRQVAEGRDGNNAVTIEFAVDEAAADPAAAADAFVDTIGVNVHLRYLDTPYADYEGIIRPRLEESGIRHVRDGGALDDEAFFRKLNDLATVGVRSNLIMSPAEVTPAEAVAIAKAARSSVASIEGPNEPNVFLRDLFPDGIREYQTQLYAAIKADPETASLPVLAPSLAYDAEDADRLGVVPGDFGNTHSYAAGQVPGVRLDTIQLPAAEAVSPGKPIMATETGYHTAVNTTGGQPGISERAGGKYLPRTYLEHFNRDVRRTFAYEFLDELGDPDRFPSDPELDDSEARFGMLRSDGSPKPAFTAITHLIRLLEDPGPAFAPTAPRYSLSGNVTDLHRTVLQKRDGTWFVILWLNARSYDLDAKADLDVPAQAVTLTLAQRVRRATTYRPAGSSAPLAVAENVETLVLQVPDEPLVVELVP
jgi:hypothetical protein